MSSSLTPIGHLWPALSLIIAIAAAVGFYCPYWICGELVHDQLAIPASFNSFRRCNYPTVAGSMGRREISLQCSRYATFSDIPTIWWKMATVIIATAIVFAFLLAIVAMPAYFTHDVITHTGAQLIGVLQMISDLSICPLDHSSPVPLTNLTAVRISEETKILIEKQRRMKKDGADTPEHLSSPHAHLAEAEGGLRTRELGEQPKAAKASDNAGES
ncbi:unnamed protein product [Soboliphyme baturini]|uniref:Modulator of VRAC current 1 n=1 Tax=Soboliphyme baturini TaxID=241478 RepID=A0A183IQM6_9BILA|nr:unnamed protein product [Soboliphyme baturini]